MALLLAILAQVNSNEFFVALIVPFFFITAPFLTSKCPLYFTSPIDLFSPKFTASITCAHIIHLAFADGKEYTAASS